MAGKSRKSINRKKVICMQCKGEVKEETEDSIECDKCCKAFHVMCTKLDKRQYEQLLKKTDEEYVCHLCVGVDGSLTVQLQNINAKLNKLDQLTDSVNFMSSKFDEIMKCMTENNKKIHLLEKDNSKLKNEVKLLKDSVKLLNDQRVKNDCVIIGLDVKDGATASESIIAVSKSIGVVLKEENIEEAYFLKKRSDNNSKQNIVVKFNSKAEKTKLMAAKKKLKESDETKSIYVNDYLSKESLELLNYAKTLKTVGYFSVYSYGGKIYAKKSSMNKPRFIRCAEEVDRILIEASTNKYQGRRSARFDELDDDDDNQSAFESPDGK